MRVVDGGERVLLRDFWNLDEGILILQHLDRICANQRKQAGEHLGQGVLRGRVQRNQTGVSCWDPVESARASGVEFPNFPS